MKFGAIMGLFLFALIATHGTSRTQQAGHQTTASSSATDEKKNIQEYIVLLRENLRDEKGEILGGVMQLNGNEAAKFWPIYDQYSVELNKLNDLRLENIKSYAHSYAQMTDEQADRLTKQAFDFRRQRTDLLAKYYERVKEAMGATTAARFLQVENQLLSLIDLQIDCRLPVMSQNRESAQKEE